MMKCYFFNIKCCFVTTQWHTVVIKMIVWTYVKYVRHISHYLMVKMIYYLIIVLLLQYM